MEGSKAELRISMADGSAITDMAEGSKLIKDLTTLRVVRSNLIIIQ